MKASIIVCFLAIAGIGVHSAPSRAQSAAQVFDNYKQAIVKITVSGRDPDGVSKTAVMGSGSIVYSGNFTLIMTAAHLLGSNSIDQSSNGDWLISNGRLDRKIKVESLDAQGRLLLINSDATVFPMVVAPGVDVAILSVPQRLLPKVKLPLNPIRFETSYEVMLMGFLANQSELTMPFQVGTGVAKSSGDFVTTQPSRFGESGGAWIGTETGVLLAVASGRKNDTTAAVSVATPIAFVLNQLRAYIDNDLASLTVSPAPKLGEDGTCDEVAFTDYSKMPPHFSKRVVCSSKGGKR